eukprot:PITA_13812
MLHGYPTVKETLGYKRILNLFSEASGMEINLSKSTIFFFNTHLALQKNLSIILGFRRGNLPSRYLGAPLTDKPWQKNHWEKILANMEKRCHHWTHRALNFAGRLVLTKEDAWKQLPKLERPEFVDLQRNYQELGRTTVNHYWTPNNRDPEWRNWAINETEGITEANNNVKDLQTLLNKRRIRQADDNDQLRWGKQGGGNFTLKEARNCTKNSEQIEKVQWSSKVWDSQFWPKTKIFLWLLMHRKTLTWENLRKKGFCGPSRCPMSNKEEETMNHLFNTCESANIMWNWAENTLQQTDRTRVSIHGTIENWRGNFSSNQRVNIIWKIMPGFITWTIWKERNIRVFLNETRDINYSIEIIIQNIRQLVLVKSKADQDSKASNRYL